GPRRQLHEPGLLDRHDLRAEHRRAQPRRSGKHRLGGLRIGSERAPALPSEDGQREIRNATEYRGRTGDEMNTQELQTLDREHVIYSWKAQGGWKPTVI